MTWAADFPAWAAIAVSVLTIAGAALSCLGAFGLLRLKDFYERVHAPTLGSTLGAGFILIASMIVFSVLETRLVVHEVLIVVFISLTTPVTLMLLVRGALSREGRSE